MDGSAKINSYRDLLVWQRAMELAVACYQQTKNFPREEIYALTSQIRRSSSSIAANIAEGYGRESAGSYVHFLKNAQGSLKELETHLLLCERVGLLESASTRELLEYADEIGRMLRGLMRAIQRNEA